MGGADLCDKLLEVYRVRQHTVNYYMHIFFYCIGISITNSWLLYWRHLQQQNISKKGQFILLPFHTEVAESSCKVGKVPNPLSWSRGRPSRDSSVPQKQVKGRPPTAADPSNDIKLDQMSHFPVFTEKQNRCRNCKTGYTTIHYTKCQVFLCCIKVRNCFNRYHGIKWDIWHWWEK